MGGRKRRRREQGTGERPVLSRPRREEGSAEVGGKGLKRAGLDRMLFPLLGPRLLGQDIPDVGRKRDH